MSLIVLIGPQAVGKMTIGRELEKRIDGKLLFNHQTLDLFAHYLDYTEDTFRLSDEMRLLLFESFAKNQTTNTTKSLIFTVMVNFDGEYPDTFLTKMVTIFENEKIPVYFIALDADIETRLERNEHEDRLKAKPSKRDLVFSRQDLLNGVKNFRLHTSQEELEEQFPYVQSLVINNTYLTASEVAEKIITTFNLT